jgi:hypothetical protein
VTPVCRAFTRPKLIHGVEWKMFYLILLGCLLLAFMSLWNPRRLLLLPVVYFGPYTFSRWAGKHDDQWGSIYPTALRHQTIYFAGADPRQADPAPERRVIFEKPKFNA